MEKCRWIIIPRNRQSDLFCVGKKNWVMIDTIAGAEASAIIYSIAENSKGKQPKALPLFRISF